MRIRLSRGSACGGDRHDFGHHVDPLGWVQPAFAQFVQALRGGGDICGVRIAVLLGFEVGGEAFGEGEGLEAQGWIVVRVISNPVTTSQCQCPNLMNLRTQYSKCIVVM